MPMRNVLAIPAFALFVWMAGAGCVRANPTLDLWRAVSTGNIAEVETLLKDGADPNARNDNGVTPLLVATMDNPAVIETLIEGGADPNVRSDDGITPLLVAVIGTLIEGEADPNARSDDGTTPLHVAAVGNKSAAIKALIAAGADPNMRVHGSPSFLTPYKVEGATLLYLAAVANNLSVIEMLIEGGANPNARSDDGTTPLHVAVAMDNPAVIETLIKGGADPNARSDDGTTLLHVAIAMDNPAVIKTLIEGGADPNARSDDGTTPLHVAAVKNKSAAIKALIAAGADPNMRGSPLLLTPSEMANLLGNSAAIQALGGSASAAPAALPPAAKPVPYDGSRPPRTVSEIKAYCERKYLECCGWSAVKICVDLDTEAFRALHR